MVIFHSYVSLPEGNCWGSPTSISNQPDGHLQSDQLLAFQMSTAASFYNTNKCWSKNHGIGQLDNYCFFDPLLSIKSPSWPVFLFSSSACISLWDSEVRNLSGHGISTIWTICTCWTLSIARNVHPWTTHLKIVTQGFPLCKKHALWYKNLT